MGQLETPAPPPSIILTATDRLIASNADGGISPLASHIVLFGEDAGKNLGAVNDIIVIGAFGLDAGLGDNQLVGTTVLGRNAASAVTGGTNNDDNTSGCVVIGRNALAVAVCMSGVVVIGCEAMANFVGDPVASGPERSVVIGNEACERMAGATQFTSNTVVGWRAMRGAAASTFASSSNVFIGDQIAKDAVLALQSNTVVGANAGIAMGNSGVGAPTSNCVIGQGAGSGIANGSRNVVIGQASGPGAFGVGEQDDIVCIGTQINAYGPKHTIIGTKAAVNQGFGVVGARSIAIGYQAGITAANGLSDICLIETFETAGGVQRGCLYAYMNTGSLILGKSNQGVDRPTEANFGTQNVKILDGTKAAAAPVGGGQFYVTAGELSWHSSAGNDQQLTGIYTVGTLPAGKAGSRCFVTDALAPAFGAAVAPGGAVFTPVYFDGNTALWTVG